jgi:SAM-dependent methyltransferase
MEIAEGFLSSSVLFALVRLGLLERLVDGPRSVADLARGSGAAADRLGRLLGAAVGLGLVEQERDGYVLPETLRDAFRSDGPSYRGHWLRLLDEFRAPMGRLEEAVRAEGGRAEAAFWNRDRDSVRRHTLAMHDEAMAIGPLLAERLAVDGRATVLDAGCGPGTYAFQLGLRNPDLELVLLDAPAVLEVAAEVAARLGVRNEVRYLPLDLAREEIPKAFDVVLASNVLQCFDDTQRPEVLARLVAATRPGGSIVVHAQHLPEDRRGGRWPSFVDLLLLCTTPGRNHTLEESREWLERAGCSPVETVRLSAQSAHGYARGTRP